MVFFLIIKSAWNSKLLPDLVLAKTTILYLFFISNRLLICQKLCQNSNTSSIIFFAFSNPGRYKFFIFPRVTSFYFGSDIFFLLEIQENNSLGKIGVDANFIFNFSLIMLLLSNLSKKSLFLFNNIDVKENKPRFILLSMRMLVYSVESLIN